MYGVYGVYGSSQLTFWANPHAPEELMAYLTPPAWLSFNPGCNL